MFGFLAERFRHGVQNCFSRQRLIIPRKNKALEWNRKFRLFWDFDRQIYGVWWQIHARLSELHSTCKNEQFKKNLMFWNKVYCFYHFWILIKICSDFLRKSTARWSKLHSTSTDDPAEKEEQLSWKTHKFLSCFVNSGVKFTEIGENFMHGCKNCILHVQTNNSKKNWCLAKRLLFLSLLNFNQNLFGILAKKYGTVVKTAFHVYRWSCRERRTNLLNNT